MIRLNKRADYDHGFGATKDPTTGQICTGSYGGGGFTAAAAAVAGNNDGGSGDTHRIHLYTVQSPNMTWKQKLNSVREITKEVGGFTGLKIGHDVEEKYRE